MIVDIHSHVFDAAAHLGPSLVGDMRQVGLVPERWGDLRQRHLETTRAADVAVVFGIDGTRTGWLIPNDYVAAHVATAPNRLIFFASIDPAREGFMAELERCHQDLKCRGVKISPVYQGVHPLDKRYYELFAYCQRHGLPVLTHMATTFTRGVPLEFARPAHMDQVACDFPDLKLILAHLGHPWEGETISVIRRHPNVFADLSALYYRPWQFYNSMRLAVEYNAHQKILFGSDFPFTTTSDSIAGVRNVNRVLASSGLPPVPAEVIEGIIHRDALSLLGLAHPRGGAA